MKRLLKLILIEVHSHRLFGVLVREMPTVFCHLGAYTLVFEHLLLSLVQDSREDALDDKLRWYVGLASTMSLTLILFMLDIGYDDCGWLRL